MDLGINGKWALVCAASKGLGKGCAAALVREGVNVVITARGAEALEATAAELRALNPAVEVRAVAGDITTRRRPRRRAGGLPAGRHPGQQRRRPAAGRLPRLGPRRLDQGARRQHADADRADQGHGRRHGRARLRPHRQHHLGRGEGADRRPRPVQRRAQRPDRFRRRPGAQTAGRAATSRSTTCCRAPSTPTACAARSAAPRPSRARRSRRCWRSAAPRSRPSASARAEEFGAICAFLCSVQAGYITGQNLLLDGGAYPGTF